jgi:hypothetical protein
MPRGPSTRSPQTLQQYPETARPELMTTFNDLVPVPGGAGTVRDLGGGFEERQRANSGSSQCQRYLDQSTSTAPTTGMSRIRWKGRSFRRDATTPQLGQPGGWSVSPMTRRQPSSRTVAEITR